MSQTTEKAFESFVEIILHKGGWQPGTNAEWDVERAIFPARIFAFLEATQPKLWEEMRKLHAAGLENLLVGALVKELDLKGTLYILRHGFKFYGKIFRLAHFKPAHGLNDEVLALYAKNQITVTRQVLCHPGKHDTVDLLFAVNGLPVATCELKNPGTGQSWRHAVRQYQNDRDPRAALFGFKTRTLVHFAADPDEVHMATRLRGEATHFLPLNRGSHPGEVQCGSGNPQHPSGYRTGYFWEEVLQRDSFLDILGHYMFVEKKEEKIDDGIVEHFRRSVMHRLGGRAKAMVVTSSRLHAVRYKLAFERYLAENGYKDVRPLVAFSGTVRDPDTGIEYTEPGMNTDVITGKSISEAQLPARFDSPDYQVLLVANKYQTGFDQPLLHTMYVDKRLDGVQAVQTLSRLNRMIPGKDAPFVLDFVNDAENIFRAFKPYFDKTELAEASDPAKLEALKHELDQAQVYHWSEVEAFAQVFYKPTERQAPADHAHMQRHLQPAVDRFKAIVEEDKREAFREKLSGYVKVYAFLSQIVPYADRDLEMLYSFGRFLLPHLPFDRDTTVIKVGEEVALQYYRLERVYAGPIDLRQGEAAYVKSPTEVGTGRAKDEKAPLSEIIEVLNERFGTQFSEEDRLFFQQIKEKACKSEQVIQTAMANPLDKFELGIRKLIEEMMIERMGENDKIVTRYMADQEFQGSAFPILAREIFEVVRGRAAIGSGGAAD